MVLTLACFYWLQLRGFPYNTKSERVGVFLGNKDTHNQDVICRRGTHRGIESMRELGQRGVKTRGQ